MCVCVLIKTEYTVIFNLNTFRQSIYITVRLCLFFFSLTFPSDLNG